MTEMEYRFQQFDKFCEKIKDERVVLYGTGFNAKEIIENYADRIQIIGIMEKQISSSYIYGKRNLRQEELISLKINVIVIASGILPLKEIFNRICGFCHANGIKIYDMYGNDLFDLFFLLEENLRTLCDRNEQVLLGEIKNYDVISIDLFGTLLNTKKGFREEVWWKVAEANKAIFTNPIQYLKARQEAKKRAEERHKANDISVIYDELRDITQISEEQKLHLLEDEKKYMTKRAILDKKLYEILRLARQEEKKVVLVSDTYYSEREIRDILKETDVQEYDIILSAADKGCTKSSGLLRMIFSIGSKGLHIGENEIDDGVCALVHGLDIFLLKSPEGLKSNSPYKDIYQSIMQWYKDGKIDKMLKYGGSSLVESINRMELLDHFAYCNEGETQNVNGKIGGLAKLEFLQISDPEISIVIPVYNQFLFTYNCLTSILNNSGEINYEIIIADDCSTDETVDIDRVIQGIRIVRNKKNVGFLRNCNQAAKRARGKYILFLNNDTFVQPGWLKKLLSLIRSSDKIGMVGSKLIYPDGRLQEAGGIVWEDASAWNFGYGQNAEAPVYNYVKEVDYVSGAAIMIRGELWREIGGFDKRFAPAYYEDTDLAFEVRKRGYKVMYHPFSIVVHYEGISNGTDVQTGLKAYQTVNRDKFLSKWQMTLQRNHFKNGTNIFVAKDRSRYRKHILVVDHYVPQHDQDAGGRCTYMYLKAFLQMGMQVTFIGDNYAYSVPYTQELLEMGIEILYGSYYKTHMSEWMQENLKYFDYIYLQRPHISIKYIDIVRELGRAKIFYFAHDLHHVRLKRQYELTGDKSELREAEKWEKVELELFNKADVGHVVGSFEQSYMQAIYPFKPIRNIPLYIFENSYRKSIRPFEERTDILYVGGFGHPPNIDAVLWFAKEVFPKVLEKHPDMVWHVVGNKPTEEILALQGKNIVIEGFVSDDRLERFYNSCRLAVVPLRVGAGVKGKIIEAAYYQLPVVTTSIGAEGISEDENALIVENGADGMAERICELYDDIAGLEEISRRERNLIENHYLLKNAIEILEMDMRL